METQNQRDQSNPPEWGSIFLGIASIFATMGLASLIGVAFRLLQLSPSDSIAGIIFKVFWLLGSVTLSNYLGGFITGITMTERNRSASVVNGLLVTELSVVVYIAIAFVGLSPLPAFNYSSDVTALAPGTLVWWAIALAIPGIFAVIFGAMAGNRHVHAA